VGGKRSVTLVFYYLCFPFNVSIWLQE